MIYDWRISIFHGCRLPQCTWEGNPMDTSSRSMQYPVPRSVDGQRTDKQIQAIQVGRASWWGPLDAWTTPAPSMACLFFWFEGSPRLLLVWLLTYGRIAEASSEFLGCSPGLPAKSISSDIHHPAVCSPRNGLTRTEHCPYTGDVLLRESSEKVYFTVQTMDGLLHPLN
jgi:hypothetical protein